LLVGIVGGFAEGFVDPKMYVARNGAPPREAPDDIRLFVEHLFQARGGSGASTAV